MKAKELIDSKGEEQGRPETGTKPQEEGRRGKIPEEEQRKQRAISKEVRECQRPPRTTSARATIAVLTSAIRPSDSLSITGPMRSVA